MFAQSRKTSNISIKVFNENNKTNILEKFLNAVPYNKH